jgi:Integrase core domain
MDTLVTGRDEPKENRVRKPRQIYAANATPLNHLPRERPINGKLHRALEFLNETCTKARTPILVKFDRPQVFDFSVFVVIEHRSRRLIYCNVTAHPSAAWTLQQLRETIGLQDRYEYLLHDRDSIFAKHLDESITRLEVKVLKSPPRSPMANGICERVIGTIRRECLDLLIPLSESHLRSILRSWISHYNSGRPHMALGPGAPDPPATTKVRPRSRSRHRLREEVAVGANSVLGGLHHEYFLAPRAASLSNCG